MQIPYDFSLLPNDSVVIWARGHVLVVSRDELQDPYLDDVESYVEDAMEAPLMNRDHEVPDEYFS